MPRRRTMRRKLRFLIVVACLSLLAVSAASAADYEHLASQGGVEAMVLYNPLGYNNQIVAFIKFLNKNRYAVHVEWKLSMTCAGVEKKTIDGDAFDMDENGSYEVNIWRSQACGLRAMQGLAAQMDVKEGNR
jgi:hypothetical protein